MNRNLLQFEYQKNLIQNVIQFNSIQFITNPLVTHGTFYIGNEHTHSMIMHRI